MSTNNSTASETRKSALTEFLADDDEDESHFLLVAPDKFDQKNLYTEVKIFLGGKEPIFITCELSRRHVVRDVIKHVLTIYRRDKMKVFECPVDQP